MFKLILRNFRTTHFTKNFEFKNIKASCFNQVVTDCGNYKNFLDFCYDSEILKRISKNEFDARLTIDYKIYKDSYVSRVLCSK